MLKARRTEQVSVKTHNLQKQYVPKKSNIDFKYELAHWPRKCCGLILEVKQIHPTLKYNSDSNSIKKMLVAYRVHWNSYSSSKLYRIVPHPENLLIAIPLAAITICTLKIKKATSTLLLYQRAKDTNQGKREGFLANNWKGMKAKLMIIHMPIPNPKEEIPSAS